MASNHDFDDPPGTTPSASDSENSSLGILSLNDVTGLSDSMFYLPASKLSTQNSLPVSPKHNTTSNAKNSTDCQFYSTANSNNYYEKSNENRSVDMARGTNLQKKSDLARKECESKMDNDRQQRDKSSMKLDEKLCELLEEKTRKFKESLWGDIEAAKKGFGVVPDCQPLDVNDPSKKGPDICEGAEFSATESILSMSHVNACSTPTNPKEQTFNTVDKTLFNDVFYKMLQKTMSEKAVNSPSKRTPFMDESSFYVEDVYGIANAKKASTDRLTDVFSDSAVVFQDDHISARSSSLEPSSENNAVSFEKNRISAQFGKSTKLNLIENFKEVDSFLQTCSSEEKPAAPENASDDTRDLALFTNLIEDEGDIDFVANYENCEEILGFSESEFHGKESGLELFQKDEENFEKSHFWEVGINDTKFSQNSTWSIQSLPQEISPPSWFKEAYADDANRSRFHVSIGQIIGARSEALGIFNDSKNRERPFFGTEVVTPPRKNVQDDSSRAILKSDETQIIENNEQKVTECTSTAMHEGSVTNTTEDNSSNALSVSAISQILADITFDENASINSEKLLREYNKRKNLKSRRRSSVLRKPKLVMIPEQNSTNSSISKLSDKQQKFDSQLQSYIAANSALKTKLPETNMRRSSIHSKENVLKNRSVEPKSCLTTNSTKSNSKDYSKKTIDILEDKELTDDMNAILEQHCKSSTPEVSADENNFNFSVVSEIKEQRTIESNILTKSFLKADKNSCCNLCHSAPQSHCAHHQASYSRGCSSSNQSMQCCGMHIPAHYFNMPNSGQENLNPFFLPPVNFLPSTMPAALPTNQNMQQTCTNFSTYSFIPYGNATNIVPALPIPLNCSKPMAAPLISVSFPDAAVGNATRDPSEIVFPGKICTGDSAQMDLELQNPTVIPLFCHMTLISASLNENPLHTDDCGVSFGKVTQITAGTFTNIKVTLTPKFEGHIKAELQIAFSHVGTEQLLFSNVISSRIAKIRYESERPQIHLSCEDKNRLDIDAVPEDTSVTKYITVTNLGNCAVPLRLIISADEQQHSFHFDVQEIKKHQNFDRSNKCLFSTPKVVWWRLTASEKFVIPLIFHASKCNNTSGNDIMSGSICAILDSPSMCEPLAVIYLSAAVGKISLSLKYPKTRPVTLTCKENSETKQHITILNNGTVSASLNLCIESENKCFAVIPQMIQLLPHEEAEATITFSPSSTREIEGLFQAVVQPYGQIFNLAQVIGKVIASSHPVRLSRNLVKTSSNFSAPKVSKPGRTSGFPLPVRCNKRCLAWGGVDVGKIQTKSFDLQNSSKEEDIQCEIFVKNQPHCFQVIDDNNCKVSRADIIVLKRESTKTLKVAYNPMQNASSSDHLVIKPLGKYEQCKAKISLTGYGGTSNVKIINLPLQEGLGYSYEVSPYNCRSSAQNCITLYNDGCRAAFVKAVFRPAESLSASSDAEIDIKPCEFVLLEKETKFINVYCHLSNEQLHQYCGKDYGVIIFYFGDEILRQKFKSSTADVSKLHCHSPLKNINFNLCYSDEEKVPLDPAYTGSKNDAALFYNSIRQLHVHLVVSSEGADSSQMSSFLPLTFLDDATIS